MRRVRIAHNAFLSCAADAQHYCPDVRLGGGRMITCLSESRDVISRDCKHALREVSDQLSIRR
ncbi:MAG: cysteine rich repeat-containing protein [Hyphomicrobiaceae bacterium]